MRARRIGPPEASPAPPPQPRAQRRGQGRWRGQRRTPTRGPRGPVRWWERLAPGGDALLWETVQRLQRRRLRRGAGLAALADALRRSGHPIRRETLSRVLNGKQRTSWETAEALAEILDVDLTDLRDRLPDAADADERRAAGERRRG